MSAFKSFGSAMKSYGRGSRGPRGAIRDSEAYEKKMADEYYTRLYWQKTGLPPSRRIKGK